MKKFLAWALSLCMMVAMLPAIPAQTAEAIKTNDGILQYTFNTITVGETYKNGTDATYLSNKDYAYICTEIGTYVTTLSEFAQDKLTYENTFNKANKRASWKASSVSVYSMTDTADTSSNPDKYRLSSSWVRMYSAGGFGLYVYANVKNRNAKVGVTLKVEEGEEGWYSIVPSYTFSKKTTDNATFTCKMYKGTEAGGVLMGKEFSTSELKTSWTDGDAGIAYFTPGEYEFTMELKTSGAASTGDNKQNFVNIRNVKLKPAAPETPENSAVFGNCGAYIQKTASGTYSATFLSGINGLDYKEVGFIVTVPEVGEFTLPTTNAYTSIAVENNSGTKTVNTASFGMDDDAFVFMATKDGIPTSITSATFQPYAIPADGGDTIYGKAFTATYVAQ